MVAGWEVWGSDIVSGDHVWSGGSAAQRQSSRLGLQQSFAQKIKTEKRSSLQGPPAALKPSTGFNNSNSTRGLGWKKLLETSSPHSFLSPLTTDPHSRESASTMLCMNEGWTEQTSPH